MTTTTAPAAPATASIRGSVAELLAAFETVEQRERDAATADAHGALFAVEGDTLALF